MNEGSSRLPTSIINRQDLQPTFDKTVGSIKYLLDEVEELRRKYQLNQLLPINERFRDDVKPLRASKSLNTLPSLRSTWALRRRIRENQKQKSFLIITKWAICDARRFHEKVRRLKCLIDGLEDITKAAGLYSEPSGPQSSLMLSNENPPPYSVTEPLLHPPNSIVERVDQAGLPEITAPTYDTIPDASVLVLSGYSLAMKRFLSAWPDESGIPRPRVRDKLLRLTHEQFRELSQDVHDELVRRQQHEAQAFDWLPSNPLLHSKRNEARKKLSTLHVVRFQHLVDDIVFEFERRFPNVPLTFPHQNPRRWGVCYPPPLLQYRAAHQSTNIDSASLAPIIRAPVPTSTFCERRATSHYQNTEPLRVSSQPNTPDISETFEGIQWPMDRVQSWLTINQFSSEWQETFKALNICGSLFLALGNGHGGRCHSSMMHQQVYPRLAVECANSGNGWDQAKEREEGKRLRRLIRRISFAKPGNQQPSTPQTETTSNASIEIFKSFRVSMEDPTYKVLPAALKKYNINAPWEQYALYIVHGDNERCLEMDEKPLILFKHLDKAGKKPMFMLRKIVLATAAPAAAAAPREETPSRVI